MALLEYLLRVTDFGNPLLSTLVPSAVLAYIIQTAVAISSIASKSDRFYDLSGSITYITCTAISLFLPYLRASASGHATGGLVVYLSAPAPGQGLWFWRQVVLSAAVGIWATRLGTFPYKRISSSSSSGRDSRFDTIRNSPLKFLGTFLAQATWVSICLLPVIGINSLPRTAFAISRIQRVYSRIPPTIKAYPYVTDILGLAIFVFGLTFKATADARTPRWMEEKEDKRGENFPVRRLWSKSRHPNYFGEITLWSGIALIAGGVLVRSPAQVALGLTGLGVGGKVLTVVMCVAGPVFVVVPLKGSWVPLVAGTYGERFGVKKE